MESKLAITPLEKAQFREARAITISSGTLRIARPEDTIAFKVKFGSPRDLQDAVSILHPQRGQLDEQRLLAFALQPGVADQLHELMRRNP